MFLFRFYAIQAQIKRIRQSVLFTKQYHITCFAICQAFFRDYTKNVRNSFGDICLSSELGRNATNEGSISKLLSQGTTLRRFTFKTVSKRSNLPLGQRRIFEDTIIQRAKAPSFSMYHRSDCMNVREDQDRTGDTMLGLCQNCPKKVSGTPFLSSKRR